MGKMHPVVTPLVNLIMLYLKLLMFSYCTAGGLLKKKKKKKKKKKTSSRLPSGNTTARSTRLAGQRNLLWYCFFLLISFFLPFPIFLFVANLCPCVCVFAWFSVSYHQLCIATPLRSNLLPSLEVYQCKLSVDYSRQVGCHVEIFAPHEYVL